MNTKLDAKLKIYFPFVRLSAAVHNVFFHKCEKIVERIESRSGND